MRKDKLMVYAVIAALGGGVLAFAFRGHETWMHARVRGIATVVLMNPKSHMGDDPLGKLPAKGGSRQVDLAWVRRLQTASVESIKDSDPRTVYKCDSFHADVVVELTEPREKIGYCFGCGEFIAYPVSELPGRGHMLDVEPVRQLFAEIYPTDPRFQRNKLKVAVR